MERDILDLYSDYLLYSTKKVTATGLSELAEGMISRDKITKFLAGEEPDGKTLWQETKKLVRQYENGEGCLIFDGTIAEKAYMDENDIICRHWDHSKGRNVKEMNILTAFYTVEKEGEVLHIPVTYQIIAKTEKAADPKSGKEKRVSVRSKNEMMREMISRQIKNQVKFGYILADSWFPSNENMKFIKRKRKIFIFEIKDNRLAAMNKQERNKGQFARIDQVEIPENTPMEVWLKDVQFPVNLFRAVFKNKDGSVGERYLVTNDLTMAGGRFETNYKKRWSVEVYHESLKQNASIGSSPAHTVRTQSNHVFAALFTFVKLERIKLSKHINHFALKSRIYMESMKLAMSTLTAISNMG